MTATLISILAGLGFIALLAWDEYKDRKQAEEQQL